MAQVTRLQEMSRFVSGEPGEPYPRRQAQQPKHRRTHGEAAEIEPFGLTAEERTELKAFLFALNGRVTELLEGSPPGTDVFNVRRAPARSEGGPVQDPSYVKPAPEGPVQDPSYIPNQRQR